MNLSLSITPLLPVWLIAGLGIAGVLVAALGLLRGARGSLLRVLAALVLSAALLNPTLRQEEREALPAVAALIVDRSPSQALDGRPARTDAVAAEVTARLDALGIETRTVTVARAGEDGTALFEPLSRTLGDVAPGRVAGAILITDGQVVDAPQAREALGFDAPLHALVTGREGEVDRRVAITAAPRFGIVGQSQSLTFRIEDEGETSSSIAEITLTLDGEPLDTFAVRAGEDVTLDVTLEHAGANYIEIAASPVENELTEVNNRAVVVVQGVREALRVLLISGEPHSGERTWRNLLKADAAIDLVHFTILRPPEKQDGTPVAQLSLIAFPTHELFQVKLEEFDLIVFDRYQQRGVLLQTYYDNIARYVRDGGAVLVASGPEYAGFDSLYDSLLSPILPAEPTGAVIEEAFSPQVTEAGARHPVTRGLEGQESWGDWLRLIESLAASEGEIVMTGAGESPLVVLSRQGEGRVAQMMSDQAWLWARGYDGGGPYVDLLRRTAHWLMQEPDLEEEALRLVREGERIVVERQTMADGVAPVTLTDPTGTPTALTLAESEDGLWRAEAPARILGLYRATDGDLTAVTNIGPLNPAEFARVTSTTERIAPIAEATGGNTARTLGADDVPRLSLLGETATRFAGTGWMGLRESRAYALTGVTTVPLLSGLLGLALLLGALGLMWWREGR